MNRVLSPRGILALSIPYCHAKESDKDLWRFTQAELENILQNSGFAVKHVFVQGHRPAKYAHALKSLLSRRQSRWIRQLGSLVFYFPVEGLMANQSSSWPFDQNKQATGFLVVAKKTNGTEKSSEMASGFLDFTAHMLIPQPYKYYFLSQKGREVVAHNAIVGNLELFSGRGAENYEEIHSQNADSLKDIHTNASTTSRLLKRYFTPGNRLLEVGCGTGFWSGQLLAVVGQAMMNDLSPDMVREHRMRRTPEELSKIEAYHSGSIETLVQELAAGKKMFDRIVAVSTLHHLEHRDQQIALLWDRLEAGGQLFFIEPCHNFKRILRVIRKLLLEYRAPFIPSTHDFLTLTEARRWVRQPTLQNGHFLALATTQFPVLGRLAAHHDTYLALDHMLQHVPLIRGQGNMLFGVLQKDANR